MTLLEVLKRLEADLEQHPEKMEEMNQLFSAANRDIYELRDNESDAKTQQGQIELFANRLPAVEVSFSSQAISLLALYDNLSRHELQDALGEAKQVKANVADMTTLLTQVSENDTNVQHKKDYKAVITFISNVGRQFDEVETEQKTAPVPPR